MRKDSNKVADSNQAVSFLRRDSVQEGIATKTERRVNAGATKANADSDASMLTNKVSGLVEGILKNQKSCSFLVNNFTLRQQKRVEEIEALAEAKAYLQGMN